MSFSSVSDHAGHEKRVCSCGQVIMQCRCPDPGKTVTVVPNGCEVCRNTAASHAAMVQAGGAGSGDPGLTAMLTTLAEWHRSNEAVGLLRRYVDGAEIMSAAIALLARIDGKEPG